MHIDGIMCSISSMLGHTNSKLVKNRQKTQNYTHLKHGCHVWHAQWAGYGHFFQTFRISCGEWVEQVRSLRNGIGAIWKFDKSCTGPLTIAGGGRWRRRRPSQSTGFLTGLIAVALVSSPVHLSCRGAFGMAFCARWWRCSEKMLPPSFAVPSGIKTRGLRGLLSSARRKCHLVPAISLRRRTREWREWEKRKGNIIEIMLTLMIEF